MKNIHLFPTDKPTRLFTSDSELTLAGYPKTTFKTGKNIYITNDEKPKLNDWFLDTIDKVVFKVTYEDILTAQLDGLPSNFKKIILTTDQDLINDGVQAIDDEFLELFVKNPSCEEVKVELHVGSLRWSDSKNTYKIIIQQEEESKKETLEEYDIKDNKIMLLEEYLECVNMYLDDLKLPRTDDKGDEYSIVGRIKILQKEKDQNKFSEEEVELVALEMVTWAISNIGNISTKSGEKFDEVMAKFRKK
jgi:hypothetical protein